MIMNQEAFLKELTELSKKYNIVIGGCGCCGSPFLSDTYFNYLERKHVPVAGSNCEYEVNDEGESLHWTPKT